MPNETTAELPLPDEPPPTPMPAPVTQDTPGPASVSRQPDWSLTGQLSPEEIEARVKWSEQHG